MHRLYLLSVNSWNWDEMNQNEWFNIKLFWSFFHKLSCSLEYQQGFPLEKPKLLFWTWKDKKYCLCICAIHCCRVKEAFSRLFGLTRLRAPSCFVFQNEPCDCSQAKSLPCVSLNVCVVFSKWFARRNLSLSAIGHSTLLTGGTKKQRENNRGGWGPKGQMDGSGWKRGLWGWNRRMGKR